MSGDNVVGTDIVFTNAVLSGRIFFADRQLYGGIPISIRYSGSPESNAAATIKTDNGGYFGIQYLDPGVYDLVAVTGDSEVTFARGVQVVENFNRQVGETSLLCLKDVVISEVASDSFKISFRTNRPASALLEYAPAGGIFVKKTLSNSAKTIYEERISGLQAETDYNLRLTLTGGDGQKYEDRGISVSTTSIVGPRLLSVAINNGAFETYSQHMVLYLSAENAAQMRIGEKSELDDQAWLNYSTTYNHTFSYITGGTKRIYVQFKDTFGNISTVQSDSILLTSEGYVGIWLNGGESITNNTKALLKAVYPEATHMMVSNYSNFVNSFWEIYRETRDWNLTAEDGTKVVYVKFKGGNANENDVFTASIELDRTAPKVDMLINNGAKVTATTTVSLAFSYQQSPPTHMKLANTEPPAVVDKWVPFISNVSWVIPKEDGDKEVYAIFKDNAGNEYGPVKAAINLDTVAPSGNSVQIRASEVESSSELSETQVASLPVFLHFNISDQSVDSIYYSITVATTTQPAFSSFTQVSKPFLPIEITENHVAVNSYRFWALFADEAGNKGYVQYANLKIDGPRIIIAPESVRLKAREKQIFDYSLENVTIINTGDIIWSLGAGASGTIDPASGLYTAPSPLLYSGNVDIIASPTNSVRYLREAHATVVLEKSFELLYQDPGGLHPIAGENYTFEALTESLPDTSTAVSKIRILHSNAGITLLNALQGNVSITNLAADEFGVATRITYTPPGGLINNLTETLRFASVDDPSIEGSITYVVNVGTNIRLSKNGEAQRGSPFSVSAEVAGASTDTITWTINPTPASEFLGSFSDSADIYTTTTTGSHTVTFYANGLAVLPTLASITASIEGVSKSCSVTVLPPILFNISPQTLGVLPGEGAKELSVVGFDYLHSNASTEVKWEFKNSSQTEYFQTESPTRGTLTKISNTKARYTRPLEAPTEAIPPSPSNIINVRAVSLSDPSASATINITIYEKVKVTIYNDLEKTSEITSVSTVAEVGKLQFYASVTPVELTNVAVSWTVVGGGTISSEGLYSAPDIITNNQVTVRATSNYDAKTYAEVTVNLSDFWLSKRTNMTDSVTGDTIPVSVVRVNPFTPTGSDFELYAGTSGGTGDGTLFGYGVWRSEFSDAVGDTSGGNWVGVPNLSSASKQYDRKYVIHDMVFSSSNNLIVATSDGLWLIAGGGAATKFEYDPTYVAADFRGCNVTNDAVLDIAADLSSPVTNRMVFVTTADGVFRLRINENTSTILSAVWLLDPIHGYKVEETRTNTVSTTTTDPATGEDVTTTTEVSQTAYSYSLSANPVSETMQTLVYDAAVRTLYCGGQNGSYYIVRNAQTYGGNLLAGYLNAFISPDPKALDVALENLLYLNVDQPTRRTIGNSVNDLVVDMYNRSTAWVATVAGLSRTTDSGTTWSNIPLTGGSSINCSTVIIDSTNTVNAMTGTEDGVYRITASNGFVSKRIRSGLGNHKLIRSLTQSAGLPGSRRKVWVGTSGGVFIGQESLDLE
ncbi:MAG: hypothetical protein WCS82_02185 [Candidatus Riflebacteria bacterium]